MPVSRSGGLGMTFDFGLLWSFPFLRSTTLAPEEDVFSGDPSRFAVVCVSRPSLPSSQSDWKSPWPLAECSLEECALRLWGDGPTVRAIPTPLPDAPREPRRGPTPWCDDPQVCCACALDRVGWRDALHWLGLARATDPDAHAPNAHDIPPVLETTALRVTICARFTPSVRELPRPVHHAL